MKFIDVFNLSKYLKRTGDNQTARIGHVNATVEEINDLKEKVERLLTFLRPIDKPEVDFAIRPEDPEREGEAGTAGGLD